MVWFYDFLTVNNKKSLLLVAPCMRFLALGLQLTVSGITMMRSRKTTKFQCVSFLAIHCLFSILMNLSDRINACWIIVIQGAWTLCAVRYGIIIFQSCYEMDFVPSIGIQKKLYYLCEQLGLEILWLMCSMGSHSNNLLQRRGLVKKDISGNRRDEPQERGQLVAKAMFSSLWIVFPMFSSLSGEGWVVCLPGHTDVYKYSVLKYVSLILFLQFSIFKGRANDLTPPVFQLFSLIWNSTSQIILMSKLGHSVAHACIVLSAEQHEMLLYKSSFREMYRNPWKTLYCNNGVL